MADPTRGERPPESFPSSGDQDISLSSPNADQGTLPPRPETPPYQPSVDDRAPLQTPPDGLDPNHAPQTGAHTRPHRRLLRVGGAALALAIAAGVGVLAEQSSSSDQPTPRTVAAGTPRPIPTTAPSITPSQTTEAPTASPAVPYDGLVPTLAGKYYSAKVYNPTIAVPIPYIAGQLPNEAIVETLLRNVDVATNTGDVNQLLYVGLAPDSGFAASQLNGQMEHFKVEKQNASDLVHVFNTTLDDRDVKLDAVPGDPMHVDVIVRNGTDYDVKYADPSMRYQIYDIELGHSVVQLPDGESADIWGIARQTVTPASFDQWVRGYQH